MALSANTPLQTEIGDFTDLPVGANNVIYEGSMVGLTSGYARALTAGDPFMGHAWEAVTGTASNAGVNVKVRSGIYRAQVTLASVAVTDVGKDVYASDDGTYTLTQSTNSAVGKVHRYVAANTCIVEFKALSSGDVSNHQHTAATDGGALTSPRVVTAIADTNGNEVFKITATANAVNEITVVNAATGNDPQLLASGEDNVGVKVTPKGTGVITLDGPITITAAKDIVLGTTTGTKIGAAANQKLGFWGAAAVVQQAAIANATDAGTTTTQLNDLLVKLRLIGIIAT